MVYQVCCWELFRKTLTQKTVQALKLLKPTPHPTSLLDLDIDELENVLKTTTPIPKSTPPLFIAPAFISMLKGFAILGGVFLLWLILCYLISSVNLQI